MKAHSITILLYIISFCTTNVFGQQDELLFFKGFANIGWNGHYVGSKDSLLNHYIKWEFCLDSAYVKQIKEVPALNFKMETYFFWDYELSQISTLALANRKMISKGKVILGKDSFEIHSTTSYNDKSTNSKQVFYISANSQLEDRFYRMKDEEWTLGHLIVYNPVE